MKRPTQFLALLALTPTLMAAEPSAPTETLLDSGQTPASTTGASPAKAEAPKDPLAAQEDLAEQAALVQQIGAEAARGFDMVEHARAIRSQIEALVRTPAATSSSLTNAPVQVRVPATQRAEANLQVSSPAPMATPSRDLSVRDTVQKLRAVVDQLERQVSNQR